MKTVLIIDDNDEVRQVVKTTLTQFGFATCESCTGEDGVEMALLRRPDLIICDLNMNGMDGFSTVAAIRELPQFAATPVILMTGSVGLTDFRRGMSCGADDYLQKPFRPDELIEAVVSRLVRHAEMLAEVERRADLLRKEAVQNISAELTAPIQGILGVVSAMRRKSPSLETEHAFASACRLNESIQRMGQITAAQASV